MGDMMCKQGLAVNRYALCANGWNAPTMNAHNLPPQSDTRTPKQLGVVSLACG